MGLENTNGVAAIATASNKVVATIASGQSPRGMVYIPNAVPSGPGTDNLSAFGAAGEAVHLTMGMAGVAEPATTVVVNNQGLIDLLPAAVTGLEPKKPYVLALSSNADGSGVLDPVAKFMTNPAGAAIVNAIGPLRRSVQGVAGTPRRYLVIAASGEDKPDAPVQVQR